MSWSPFHSMVMPVVLAAAFSGATLVYAADAQSPSGASSNAVAATLEYQEVPYSVINWDVSLTTQTIHFRKEPTYGSGKVIRGVLNVGGNLSNSIPFIWARDARKLHLDLNRNQDLTDDPAGVFSGRGENPAYYQTFTNIHLPLNAAAGGSRLLADITLYDGRSFSDCSIAVRSFWQGKLTLHGQDWQVGIIPGGIKSSKLLDPGRLLLRSWDKRDQPFNADDRLLATVPYARKLFFGGHPYELTVVPGEQAGKVLPAIRFEEKSVPMGNVIITGLYIQRFVLPGGPLLVVVDKPSGTVQVPSGTYDQPDVLLEQGGTEAYRNSSQELLPKPITVNDRTLATLTVGGPLTNSAIATRQGRDLRLDYQLVGAGGEIYQLAQRDNNKPPAYAIYKGEKLVASGKFEFG